MSRRSPNTLALSILLSLCTVACRSTPAPAARSETSPRPLVVGFLLLDGVYGSELVAPWDVFHHTVFHTEPGMRVLGIGRTRAPVRTFEGLVVRPDCDLESAPRLDVLVVPSAEHNMGRDLEDGRLISWVAERGRAARHVMSVCDGAFVLAEAGLLDGKACTTFPADAAALARRHPKLSVLEDVVFVADGKAITGAGGARSYEPALYLVEKLYGKRVAEGVAKGLVLDWRLEGVPHHVGGAAAADRPARPGCWLPGDRVPAQTWVEDAHGRRVTLGELTAEDPRTRAIVLWLAGGASGDPERGRCGMWCEDSFFDLATMHRLVADWSNRGVLFVPVLCPPIHHEARFGFAPGAFSKPDHPRYAAERARFVAATEALAAKGLLPFDRIWFDPHMRLLQGRFKWHRDRQTYGTPTLWVLDRDLRVRGEPFFGNNYEAEGGRLRYVERDVAARLRRVLGAD